MGRKLVIFDCDGTIVDSQNAIVTSMERAFTSSGLQLPLRPHILNVVGLSLSSAIGRLIPDADEKLLTNLAEKYKAAFGELRQSAGHHEPLFPGAREAIAVCAGRQDLALGIATGKSRRGVDAIISREGFEGVFDTIQTADTHPSKPHPSMVLAAMAETGAEPARTVMVGDTMFDVEMAQSAGVASIAVGWGYHPRGMLAACAPDALIETFEELPETLERLLRDREKAA